MIDTNSLDIINEKLKELSDLLVQRGARIVFDIDNGEAFLVPTSVCITDGNLEEGMHPVQLSDQRGLSLPIDSFSSDFNTLATKDD